MINTLLKIGTAVCALGVAGACAFQNPQPPAPQARPANSGAAGPTQPGVAGESESERIFRELDMNSRYSR